MFVIYPRVTTSGNPDVTRHAAGSDRKPATHLGVPPGSSRIVWPTCHLLQNVSSGALGQWENGSLGRAA